MPAHDSRQSLTSGKGCRLPDLSLFERMAPLVVSQTDHSLAERFGISYNTWRKLKQGHPIRASLIERLERRVRDLEHDQARSQPSQPLSS
jgi:hypothetical protein